MTISVGSKLPDATLLIKGDQGVKPVAMAAKLSGRKVVIFGLPGAFTGTCSTSHVPSFMRVAVGREWARSHGRLVKNPQPGDVFFMLRTNGTGHTGIVESVNADGTITTIEGNTNGRGSRLGDRVARRVRTIGSNNGNINGGFMRPIGHIDPEDVVRTRPTFRVRARRVTRLRHRVRR